MTPALFCLHVFYETTGHTSVLTFDSAFDRGLLLILLRNRPVQLNCVDYPAVA